jgi:hypothetical protein
MTREHRSACFGLCFVWSGPVQFFAGAAAAMIEQDRGNGPPTRERDSSVYKVTDPLWTPTVSVPQRVGRRPSSRRERKHQRGRQEHVRFDYSAPPT